ncbi:MAG: cupin domain-containing protein [Candidatus Pacearchaeota archaeon]|nr:cupin domain-containing protein [Candidatus Pacearchaeota archaeon]
MKYNEHEPFVKDVYLFQTAPNVCQQILREIFQHPDFSIAHVTMRLTSPSLLHKHDRMEEIYYLTRGAGVIQVGASEYVVHKGDFVVIPPNQEHKLSVIGERNLEHLVFALPAFDPEDVQVLDEKNNNPVQKEFNRKTKKPFTARDGAKVYELDSAGDRERRRVGFAAGFLEPHKKAVKHYHNVSDEIYYVVSGNGTVQLNEDEKDVQRGSLIYVPKGTLHGLSNPEDTNLEILCVSFPEYKEEDFLIK